jgi:hypothetical protein
MVSGHIGAHYANTKAPPDGEPTSILALPFVKWSRQKASRKTCAKFNAGPLAVRESDNKPMVLCAKCAKPREMHVAGEGGAS